MKVSAETSPEEIKALIDHEYHLGGHTKGWSYIFGPLASRERPEIVTVGLNPGGGRGHTTDSSSDAYLSQDFDPTVRNSYFDQQWTRGGEPTPLQRQIKLLASSHFPDISPHRILSFQFIPFRSAAWSELPSHSRRSAIRLGSNLLDWTLGLIDNPKLVLGFGLGAVEKQLLDWFEAKHCETVPTGWGKTTARVYRSPRAGKVVLLPHLSRFRVIGRKQFFREAEVFAVGGLMSDVTKVMTGGCQCGRIRYTVQIDSDEAYLCHCRMCQRATGGFAASFVQVSKDGLNWQNEPDWYQSSPIAHRPFCSRCGTPLGFDFIESSGKMDLTLGSFDEPGYFRPALHSGAEGLHEAWLDTKDLPRHYSATTESVASRWKAAGLEVP